MSERKGEEGQRQEAQTAPVCGNGRGGDFEWAGADGEGAETTHGEGPLLHSMARRQNLGPGNWRVELQLSVYTYQRHARFREPLNISARLQRKACAR